MRKHRDEMVRFARTEEGTEVWFRYSNVTKWGKVKFPAWNKDTIYIVDDEYAELRKESHDTGRPIQVYNPVDEWVTSTAQLQFNGNIKNYRLKPEEFEYPICKKDKVDSCIVKFTGLTEGEVIDVGSSRLSKVGFTSSGWDKHTDTSVWENVDYKEFKYPIYKKDKNCSLVIKFTGLKDGVVVEGTSIYSVGYKADDWYPHTDTNEWEDVDYTEPTYYYQWESMYDFGVIERTRWMTDEYAEQTEYNERGWKKIESSKRTWEN